jgi:GNAT superfamily N-acetyltransferase
VGGIDGKIEKMKMTSSNPDYRIAALNVTTWSAFAALTEKHNGIFGGCWCTAFHRKEDREGFADGQSLKKHLVERGEAHAALVMDGDNAVGWCQFGSPKELPQIYHRKEYAEAFDEAPPYRLTCFFVDRDHRRDGVAKLALQGALALIAADGGGVVEGYPVTLEPGKKISSSFLYSGTREMFEEAGFEEVRSLGTKRTVMRKAVSPV